MQMTHLIGKKRTGQALSEAEIAFVAQGYARGEIPDYQMSAWLMAVLWRGLSKEETFALTGAMVASGEVLNLSGFGGFALDKHSTGGVGDKTTLAVVPIWASAGLPVAKMSGRGLGHTGGTLDKLESIPGLRTRLTTGEILAQVGRIGACICAQTETLVPADARMYALRDATSTVESLPLIASSIMSKKIAGGSRGVVLDVKVGGGAFMKTRDEARALAGLMMEIGAAHGLRAVALLSDMDAPLGRSVGNGLEVREAAALLRGDAGTEPRLLALVCALAGAGFVIAGACGTQAEGEARAREQIASGAAFRKLVQIVQAQGGDASSLEPDADAGGAAVQWDVKAARAGFITHIGARAIGLAAMGLGAGRAAKDDRVDPAAGIVLRVDVGSPVAAGDPLATLYTSTRAAAQEAALAVLSAFTVEDAPAPPVPLLYETLGL